MAEHRPPPIDDLEAALTDLGGHIDHPRGAELSTQVVARLAAVDHDPRRSRWAHVAIAAGVLMVALLTLPAPRQALADWLGIGTVRVVRTDRVPDRTGSVLRLGHLVSLDEARRRMPFTILGPSRLGAPSAVYAGEPSAESVTLLWGPGDGVPVVADTGVGVLLTEMAGTTGRELIEKQLAPDTTLESVAVGDSRAYWIAGGQHELQYVDPDDRTRPDTTRLAANTLLWEVDGVTFRLESRLGRDAAVQLAGDLEPLA
jgi:hypothetical protein